MLVKPALLASVNTSALLLICTTLESAKVAIVSCEELLLLAGSS
jgi:hypothetical protein